MLKIGKAPRSDKVDNEILKFLAETVAPPLTEIFNKILLINITPS